jgi:hypothetical protein
MVPEIYNPIGPDLRRIKPQTEADLPAKLLYDLAAMLQAVLEAEINIRVYAPTALPSSLTQVSDGEVILLVIERQQIPWDLEGSAGTLGVRRGKRLVVELQALCSSAQQPSALSAKMMSNIPNLVERAVAANCLLPSRDGSYQLYFPMQFADEGPRNYPYGYVLDQAGGRAPVVWRSRQMRVEAIAIYNMTALGNIGSVINGA